jgi:RND superfamily putative drug exporter
MAGRLAGLPGVDTAVAPAGTNWRRGGSALVEVVLDSPTSSPSGKAQVAPVERAAAAVPGVLVAGDRAVEADVVYAYYSRFALVVALVAVVTFLALARAFRSPLLAFKAVLMNLLSLLAAYGALVLAWQRGWGSQLLWNIPANGVVVDFVPLDAVRVPIRDIHGLRGVHPVAHQRRPRSPVPP